MTAAMEETGSAAGKALGLIRRRPRPPRRREAVGVSARSRWSSFKWLEKVAPDLASQAAAGKVRLSRACRIARDRVSDGRKRAALAPPPARLRVELHHGPFQRALAGLRDVDAVIADPPYDEKALPLLRDLALCADRVLKPDGVLAVLYPQDRLPPALARLSVGRTYRWTMCVLISR